MTLSEAKKHYFNESLEIGLASEETLQQLATWLEDNGYDPEFAWQLWDMAQEEFACMLSEI